MNLIVAETVTSLTLPGFLAWAGIDVEYRLGDYVGLANQQV